MLPKCEIFSNVDVLKLLRRVTQTICHDKLGCTCGFFSQSAHSDQLGTILQEI